MRSPTVFRVLLAAVLTGAALGAAAPAAAAPAHRPYRVTDLGTLGGATSTATALNDRGHVVGYSTTAEEETRAFVWRGGRMTELPTPDGFDAARAHDVNNHGVAVGRAGQGWGQGGGQAVLWRAGKATVIAPDDSYDSRAVAINDAGQVLIESQSERTGDTHRFLWQDGRLRDLGFVPVYTETVGMNDRGDVIGTLMLGGFPCDCHAARWRDGVPTDLGTLGYTEGLIGSFPHDINNRDEIVGWALTADAVRHAFRWRGGRMQDLGTLGGPTSTAVATNDHGTVIGYADDATGTSRPALWRHGAARDLTRRGVTAADEIVDVDDFGRLLVNRAGRATLLS
jgi:probable HAF family extracellular repeat protein